MPITDIAGNPRVSNGRIDIGAYENLGTSINKTIINNSIAIYPNPNNGNFILDIENADNKAISLHIYDISGRNVFNENFENKAVFKKNINVSSLESGIYLVKISDGNIVNHKNIVISK
ncbi:MAG: hypothetical protein A2046_00230 [Bacteroidetes bacterium GWA2_30_7]|nr:MAG: hypothetical protein A2046_00230 [Bacteroidetes bacterium GWA2_30_7]